MSYLGSNLIQPAPGSATNVCFDMSGFKFLTNTQLIQYNTAWATFNKVQTYNSNVSTLRATGNYPMLSYYIFPSTTEKSSYTTGQFLHQQRYPNSNWNSVETN